MRYPTQNRGARQAATKEKMLRWILCKTRKDHIRNENFMRDEMVKSLSTYVLQKHHVHAIRMYMSSVDVFKALFTSAVNILVSKDYTSGRFANVSVLSSLLGTIQVLRNAVGVSAFPEKNIK